MQITSKNVNQNPGDFHVISPVGNHVPKLHDFNTENRQSSLKKAVEKPSTGTNQSEQLKPFFSTDSNQFVNRLSDYNTLHTDPNEISG